MSDKEDDATTAGYKNRLQYLFHIETTKNPKDFYIKPFSNFEQGEAVFMVHYGTDGGLEIIPFRNPTMPVIKIVRGEKIIFRTE